MIDSFESKISNITVDDELKCEESYTIEESKFFK